MRATVITVSDTVAAGAAPDRSGPAASEGLQTLGFSVGAVVVVPDSAEDIRDALLHAADVEDVDVVLTTGGTGLAPRDVTPAATLPVLDREAPGLADLVRAAGADRVPTAALSCGVAGLRGGTLIVNLPGSVGGVRDALAALEPVLRHAVGQARGTQLVHAHGREAMPAADPVTADPVTADPVTADPVTADPVTAAPAAPGRVVRAAVTDVPLDLAGLVAAVSTPVAGGLGIFAGAVRNHDEDRPVTSLTYEAHPSAEAVLREVCGRAAARPGVSAVAVEHRVGPLAIGDLAVVVAVSAPHRAEALEACRWLIDTLKSEVPIWKHQTYADGTADWVGAC